MPVHPRRHLDAGGLGRRRLGRTVQIAGVDDPSLVGVAREENRGEFRATDPTCNAVIGHAGYLAPVLHGRDVVTAVRRPWAQTRRAHRRGLAESRGSRSWPGGLVGRLGRTGRCPDPKRFDRCAVAAAEHLRDAILEGLGRRRFAIGDAHDVDGGEEVVPRRRPALGLDRARRRLGAGRGGDGGEEQQRRRCDLTCRVTDGHARLLVGLAPIRAPEEIGERTGCADDGGSKRRVGSVTTGPGTDAGSGVVGDAGVIDRCEPEH